MLESNSCMTLYFNDIRDDFERSLLLLDVLHQRGNEYPMNLDPVGVRVHAISPGPLKTRAASGIKGLELMLNEAAHKAPLGELVDIMDVSWTCAYLATPFAHRVTGGTVYVDGGANIIA